MANSTRDHVGGQILNYDGGMVAIAGGGNRGNILTDLEWSNHFQIFSHGSIHGHSIVEYHDGHFWNAERIPPIAAPGWLFVDRLFGFFSAIVHQKQIFVFGM